MPVWTYVLKCFHWGRVVWMFPVPQSDHPKGPTSKQAFVKVGDWKKYWQKYILFLYLLVILYCHSILKYFFVHALMKILASLLFACNHINICTFWAHTLYFGVFSPPPNTAMGLDALYWLSETPWYNAKMLIWKLINFQFSIKRACGSTCPKVYACVRLSLEYNQEFPLLFYEIDWVIVSCWNRNQHTEWKKRKMPLTTDETWLYWSVWTLVWTEWVPRIKDLEQNTFKHSDIMLKLSSSNCYVVVSKNHHDLIKHLEEQD